jgi:hypothetical protein
MRSIAEPRTHITKCSVYDETGLFVMEVAPQLYRATKRQQYRNWALWVKQAGNLLRACCRLLLSSVVIVPGVVFWIEKYGQVQATSNDINVLFVLSVVIGVGAFMLMPSFFGIRNVFADALAYHMRRHVPELRPYTGGLTFVLYAVDAIHSRPQRTGMSAPVGRCTGSMR